MLFIPITDPWDEGYIYLHEWLIFMVNVGKYTSPLDPMGVFIFSVFFWGGGLLPGSTLSLQPARLF